MNAEPAKPPPPQSPQPCQASAGAECIPWVQLETAGCLVWQRPFVQQFKIHGTRVISTGRCVAQLSPRDQQVCKALMTWSGRQGVAKLLTLAECYSLTSASGYAVGSPPHEAAMRKLHGTRLAIKKATGRELDGDVDTALGDGVSAGVVAINSALCEEDQLSARFAGLKDGAVTEYVSPTLVALVRGCGANAPPTVLFKTLLINATPVERAAVVEKVHMAVVRERTFALLQQKHHSNAERELELHTLQVSKVRKMDELQIEELQLAANKRRRVDELDQAAHELKLKKLLPNVITTASDFITTLTAAINTRSAGQTRAATVCLLVLLAKIQTALHAGAEKTPRNNSDEILVNAYMWVLHHQPMLLCAPGILVMGGEPIGTYQGDKVRVVLVRTAAVTATTVRLRESVELLERLTGPTKNDEMQPSTAQCVSAELASDCDMFAPPLPMPPPPPSPVTLVESCRSRTTNERFSVLNVALSADELQELRDLLVKQCRQSPLLKLHLPVLRVARACCLGESCRGLLKDIATDARVAAQSAGVTIQWRNGKLLFLGAHLPYIVKAVKEARHDADVTWFS